MSLLRNKSGGFIFRQHFPLCSQRFLCFLLCSESELLQAARCFHQPPKCNEHLKHRCNDINEGNVRNVKRDINRKCNTPNDSANGQITENRRVPKRGQHERHDEHRGDCINECKPNSRKVGKGDFECEKTTAATSHTSPADISVMILRFSLGAARWLFRCFSVKRSLTVTPNSSASMTRTKISGTPSALSHLETDLSE